MKNKDMTFGNALRSMRINKRKTIADMARFLRIKIVHYSDLEHDRLEKIHILKSHVDELVRFLRLDDKQSALLLKTYQDLNNDK